MGLGVALVALALPAQALAGHGLETLLKHGLDHPSQPFVPPSPPSTDFNSGGTDAEWNVIETIATGNPHTDIDFFHQDGETYLSAGTLGAGPNSGGQTIVQLTDGNTVDPQLISAQPSASCLSDPSQATGLQHDVEATPKGNVPLNIRNPYADRSDTQLLIDATDAPGRCHDQGTLGLPGAPQGGLEIIDVTNPAAPAEIALTSHIGESHTVNIDPKRPHIAYSVTSDNLGLNEDGKRTNQTRDSTSLALDGFEVVDFSSCMDFPGSATLNAKRGDCKPKVYRYRYPNKRMALGHTDKDDTAAIFGCHELEVYPSDLLTCGSGNTLIGLDMSKAFRTMGTPNDYTDDKPRGKPLPCTRRDILLRPGFTTGAKITDCVDGQGQGTRDLIVSQWLKGPTPSLQGVKWIGSAFHQGGGPQNTSTPYPSSEDIAFNHESELTASGRYLLATDERGGGVLPPGATCSPGAENPEGNGGIHAFSSSGSPATRPNRPRMRGEPTPGPRRTRRRSSAPRSQRRPRRPSAPPTCSSRSRARTASSWAGTRRAPGSWTSPRPRAGSSSPRPAT